MKVQLKQQRVLRDKIRQEVIRQQKISDRGASGRARKSHNNNNDHINDSGTLQKWDGNLQQSEERVLDDTNPPPQQVETAVPFSEQWTPAAPTNESCWY